MASLRRLAGTLTLIASLGLVAGDGAAQPSAAQEETADQVFAAAREAFRAGDYQGAAELFHRANILRPSANTTFNEAQSWRRAGEDARAADAYAAAAEAGGLDDKLAAAGERQLAALRKELGQLMLTGPDDGRVTVAHVLAEPLPRTLHLAPGQHTVTLLAPDGRRDETVVTITAGATEEQALSYPEEQELLAPAPPADPGPPMRWILGWTALGLGAAGGIVAGVLGARFNAVLDDYEAGGYVDTSLEDEALRLRAATNGVAFSAAIIGATGAILLLTTLGDDDDEPQVSLRVAPTGGALRVRF